MNQPRIVIFGRDDDTTRMVYHRLAEQFSVQHVVLEESVSRVAIMRRRARKLGIVAVFGQVLFVGVVTPVLRRLARRRLAELHQTLGFCDASIPSKKCTHVTSINERSVIKLVEKERPDLIVVNGTRLLSRTLLSAVKVPIINIHLGWNPQYRGGNGGYWALAEGDPEHCGVTVHHIDAGVDTGAVLARVKIEPTKDDTFVTYPLLQLAAGLNALVACLVRPLSETTSTTGEPSGMWYHPTAWGYLWRRWRYGVK